MKNPIQKCIKINHYNNTFQQFNVKAFKLNFETLRKLWNVDNQRIRSKTHLIVLISILFTNHLDQKYFQKTFNNLVLKYMFVFKCTSCDVKFNQFCWLSKLYWKPNPGKAEFTCTTSPLTLQNEVYVFKVDICAVIDFLCIPERLMQEIVCLDLFIN